MPPAASAVLTPFNPARSLVRVSVTGRAYDHLLPGCRPHLHQWTGSGVVIEAKGDRYILTNAHVATNQIETSIEFNNGAVFLCDPVFVGHDGDLALLKVKPEFEATFIKQSEAATFWSGSYSSQLGHEIVIHGFSSGKYCVKKGTINGIDEAVYVHFRKVLELLSVDAAIHHGDSGGCAEIEGYFAGIPFQAWNPAVKQGFGHIIPITVIRHFLEEFERGMIYQGFPVLRIQLQSLGSTYLREYYQWPYEDLGMLVQNADSDLGLKEGDIIFSIDGKALNSSGKLVMENKQLLNYARYIDTKFVGDKVTLQVKSMDESKSHSVEVLLKADTANPMPIIFDDYPPAYVVLAPFVLQEFESRYLEDYLASKKKSPEHLLQALSLIEPNSNKRLVFISQILPSEWSKGYDDSYKEVPIYSINEVLIHDLRQVVELLDGNDVHSFVIKLIDGKTIVVPNVKKYQKSKFLDFLRTNELSSDKSLIFSGKSSNIQEIGEGSRSSLSTKSVQPSPEIANSSCCVMSNREGSTMKPVIATPRTPLSPATHDFQVALNRFLAQLPSASPSTEAVSSMPAFTAGYRPSANIPPYNGNGRSAAIQSGRSALFKFIPQP